MAFLKVFLLAIVLVLLPGCDTTHSVSGEILEYHTNADDRLTALVIRTDEGETVGLVPPEGDERYATVWLSGDTVTEFRAQYPYTVMVSAECERKQTTMQRLDGTEIPAYVAEWVTDDDKLIQPGAYTFSDGATADLWESGFIGFYDRKYTLSDGTELLWIEGRGPENVQVGNLASFNDLSPAAQEQILAFYEGQEPLYDERAELERAYGFYQEDPENFQSLLVGQNISPCYSNERIISFFTTTTLPLKPRHITEVRLCHTFDRETGKPISNYDLFTVPPEELIATLLELSNAEYWEDAPTMEEYLAALKPEYIRLSDDHISIDFPGGTLPGHENTYGIGFSHTPETWALIQPWARPESSASG